MTRILSLAMIKMEKNFVAHNEKGYPRNPYQVFPLMGNGKLNLGYFVIREMDELQYELYAFKDTGLTREQLYKTMLEVADVSNTLDFLFERLLKEYHILEETTI